MPVSPESNRYKAIEMHREHPDLSKAEIARSLGVSRERVRQYLLPVRPATANVPTPGMEFPAGWPGNLVTRRWSGSRNPDRGRRITAIL